MDLEMEKCTTKRTSGCVRLRFCGTVGCVSVCQLEWGGKALNRGGKALNRNIDLTHPRTLLMPIPKAMVAETTEMWPSVHRRRTQSFTPASRPGVCWRVCGHMMMVGERED